MDLEGKLERASSGVGQTRLLLLEAQSILQSYTFYNFHDEVESVEEEKVPPLPHKYTGVLRDPNWNIAKVDRLRQSKLYTMSPADYKAHDGSVMKALDFGLVIEWIIIVAQEWMRLWGHNPLMNTFLNAKCLMTELEESVPPIAYLLSYISTKGALLSEITIADVCSGKGFMSFLLSFLCTFRPKLRRSVQNVLMVDRRFDGMNLHHLNALYSHNLYKLVPCAAYEFNVFNSDFDLFLSRFPNVLLLGMHLCRRLSPRLIEILHTCKASYMFLGPCCLPQKRTKDLTLNGHTIRSLDIHEDPDPYGRWIKELTLMVDDQRFGFMQSKVPLQGGAHRCNCFIEAIAKL